MGPAMCDGLKVLICSDVGYDKLIAEIYHDGKYVALISQEDGPDRLVVEFPGPGMNEQAIARQVDLAWLEAALPAAKRKLIEG